MNEAFIRKGHGYDNPTLPGRERCTAFDGFHVIAAPLGEFGNADRESRIYRRASGNGTDYGSHAIKLAKTERGSGLYILMHNGSGREVLRVPSFYDGGDLEHHIVELPERLQYALLYTIWQTARNARDEAAGKTRKEWAQAFVDGRIRKRRRGGRVYVEIETPEEQAARKRAA